MLTVVLLDVRCRMQVKECVVRFEILMVVSVGMTVSWDVTSRMENSLLYPEDSSGSYKGFVMIHRHYQVEFCK
jgi:hypothetical protein